MIKILIADDHKILREGLKALLLGSEGFEVIAEAGDGREAVTKARKFQPDIVIMDIAMPGLNGIEATKRIRRHLQHCRVLILSMYSSKEYVIEALRAGASGYLMKETASRDLISAVKKIFTGDVFLDGAFSQYVIDEFLKSNHTSNKGLVHDLTSREREVLQMIAEGKSNKIIADILSLSLKTVGTHRQNIMKKLDIHDAVGLTKFAIRAGLVVIE